MHTHRPLISTMAIEIGIGYLRTPLNPTPQPETEEIIFKSTDTTRPQIEEDLGCSLNEGLFI
jgi:hypothetical protein